jgi:MFS transporter, putative metabolite:H+ symporter
LSTDAQLASDSGARRETSVVPERLTPYLVLLLAFLAIAGFYDAFATSFRYTMTTYVRASFGVPMDVMVGLFSWIYLGSCLSFVPRVLADVWGRKAMLLATMVGLCVLQWLVGFARNPTEYAVLLTLLAIFYRSDIWLVVMSEEAPPRHRGLYSALMVAASGSGSLLLGQLVKGMSNETDAWKEVARFPVYGLVLSIPILLFMRETRQFVKMKSKKRRLIDWAVLWAPFRRPLLKILLIVSVLKTVIAGGVMSAVAIIETEYLRVDNGFSQEVVGSLVQWDVFATTMGWLVAGFASDRIGRRRCFYGMAGFYVASLLCLALLPKGSLGVMVASVTQNFSVLGVYAILRVATMELFPNDCRASASAWTDLFLTLFAALVSMGLSSALKQLGVPLSTVILVAALAVPLVVPLYALLPETKGRRLETI